MSLLLPGALALDLDAPLAHLAEHGYARLGQVLAPEAAEQLRQRADDVMLGRREYPGLFFQADSPTGSYDDLEYRKGWRGPSLEYRKIEKIEVDPLYRAWIENPLFERIARRLIPDGVSLYRAIVMTKAASGGTMLPFHQDGGRFWGIDRAPTLQVWTALDDAPLEAGCVEVVPGTHHAGLTTPNGGSVPSDFLERERALDRVIPLPAKAGEVLLLHNHVWHRSGLNRSGRPRRALSACYMSAQTRCLRTKREPRRFVRLFEAPPS
jgi:hypothetical protein